MKTLRVVPINNNEGGTMPTKYKELSEKEVLAILVYFRVHIKNLWRFVEVSDDIESDGIQNFEYIYRYETSYKNRFILVFSSVDKRTGKFRKCGSDAVRFVIQEVRPNGNYYYKLGKCYRTTNLRKNMEKKLRLAIKIASKLKPSDFTPDPDL